MADTLRIKRRTTGSPGAPTSLANAEIAYNEVDHTLYYGEGTGGAGGSASVIVGIGGQGMGSTSNPVMDGVAAPGTGTLWSKFDHVHPSDTTRAPLNSPSFTGVPVTAATPAPGDNTTKLATTAFVGAAISAGVSGTYLPLAGGTITGPNGVAISGGTTNAGFSLGSQFAASSFDLSRHLGIYGGSYGLCPTTNRLNYNVTTGASHRFIVNGVDIGWFDSTGFVAGLDINANTHKIVNLVDPTNPQDAATKLYVDNVVQGLDAKASVRVATTGTNITLSGTQAIDGVPVIAGDRVLVKDQTTPSANGIYIVSAGAWTRALDVDTWNELIGAFTFVEQGTVNPDTGWICTVDQGGTLGSTGVSWVQFSSAGVVVAGDGLTKLGTVISAVGTANRITVNPGGIDISTAYVGQATITTLGTVASGTWNATVIGASKGGTGATTLTGYVKGTGAGVMTASTTIPNTDIAGLGTMSTQNANAVNITGGVVDGVVLDCGTF